MMPMRITISGIPCISGDADVELKPINVIYGPNQSCKTTLARYVYAAIKLYSGHRSAVRILPKSKATIRISGSSDAEFTIDPDRPVQARVAGTSGPMSIYLPSHRVAYISSLLFITSGRAIFESLPGEASSLISSIMDSLQDMIAGYLRSLLGVDADFMMRDLAMLDIDINTFAASNDSMTNMEVIFAVLNRAPQGAVVVIDDVDNYLDDSYADALSEIASMAKNRGVVLFATTRRGDVASVKVQDAALFKLEPVDGRWSLHSYS
jgi:hypothetical protein